LNNYRTIENDVMTFGPVPSRRLGQSLGINNIPPKTCSYACIYCQLGRTLVMQTERSDFYDPELVFEQVRNRVEEVRRAGEPIDYLSFVPDGEPTLDLNLGREIELVRPLGIKVAVITNTSLLWRQDVRDELALADWVSLKVDAVREEVWRRIDRPHGRLHPINDGAELLEELADFLARLRPETAYLAIPTRPPAEENVRPPDEGGVTRAWSILSGVLDNVECLTGYEGNTFFSGGRVEEDLLAITSVHPMRADAVDALLARTGADRSVVRKLVAGGELVEVDYGGQSFLTRKLTRRRATRSGER